MEIKILDNKDNVGVLVSGDLYFRLINSKNNNLICRWSINTSFVNVNTNTYTLTKESVDPDSIKKSNKFSPDFSITIHFKDVCKTCLPAKSLDTLCNDCKKAMPEELIEWTKIKNICDEHEI